MERCIHVYLDNAESLASHNFEEAPFFMFEGDFVDSGFDALPPPKHNLPKDFPFCCKYHSGVLADSTNWYSRFPNCCKHHKKLSKKPWFRREAFVKVPLKVVRSLTFTQQHIEVVAKNPDWYKDTTDYIEYCLHSYGSPSVGAHLYVLYLLSYLHHTKIAGLGKRNKEALVEYIEQQQKKGSSTHSDPNLLYTVFQKWLKTLPDIEALSTFKSRYLNKVPTDILFHKPEYNPYLGLAKARLKTPKQLVDELFGHTRTILHNVNTRPLAQQADTNARHQIDVAGSNHSIRQNKLLGRYSKGELKYVDVVQEWLQNEIDYFSFVTPLLNKPGLPAAGTTNNFHFASGSVGAIVQGDNANQTTYTSSTGVDNNASGTA